MYLLMVILLLFVFPVASIVTDLLILRRPDALLFLVGKWFVFWGVGVRLFTAGIRQSLKPRFTAKEIFQIKSDEPLVIVQELGFANLSLGLLGLSSIFNLGWIMPAGIAGGLFYGLAGLKHLLRKQRNVLENVAMISNLFFFGVIVFYIAGSLTH